MKNNTLHFKTQPEQSFSRKFKAAVIALALLWGSQSAFAQSVGINTNNPDPSASLEVAGTNKGLLIPRISLTSSTDKTTIPNPATALLVYNTNAGLGKTGFYYNSGTSGNPDWSLLGAGAATITLPFSQIGTNSGPLFLINNQDGNSASTAISGLALSAIGVRGATSIGTGIVGHTLSTGKGVLASAANVNGTALEVNGRMQIHGPGQTIAAGRVLTSDASGYATWQNPGGDVAFSASGIKGGGSQVLANNATIKVPFVNQDYDLGNDYIDVNGVPYSTFMAPFNGIYHFEAVVEVLGSSVGDNGYNNELSIVRTRNGQTTILATDIDYAIGSTRVYLSRDVQLQTGDRVHVNVSISANQFSGSMLVQPEAAYFSGHLVVKQ